jgi:hypothetical protein
MFCYLAMKMDDLSRWLAPLTLTCSIAKFNCHCQANYQIFSVKSGLLGFFQLLMLMHKLFLESSSIHIYFSLLILITSRNTDESYSLEMTGCRTTHYSAHLPMSPLHGCIQRSKPQSIVCNAFATPCHHKKITSNNSLIS